MSSNCFRTCFCETVNREKVPPFHVFDIESELIKVGHQRNYIHRALRVYHRNYGSNYDIAILSEIIFRLNVKDAIKKQQHVRNTFHSKISIYAILQTLGFSNYLICKGLAQYRRANLGRPYKFDIIAKQILQMRARTPRRSASNTKNSSCSAIPETTHLLAVPKAYDPDNLAAEGNKEPRNKSNDTMYIHSSCTTFNDTVRIVISEQDSSSSGLDHILDSVALIQMAIDNFPRFEWNKMQRVSPTSKGCEYKLRKCHSFIRINYILYWYQGWVYSNRSRKTETRKCGFYKVINKYDYSNSKLLDDMQHLMCCHAFEDIYNKLQCRCHQIDCVMLKRNSNNQNHNNLYFDVKDEEETNVEQICDVLHCYFLHSYDIGMRFTKQEQKEIDKINKSKKNSNVMNANSLKFEAMKDILNAKQKRLRRININVHKEKQNGRSKYKTDISSSNLADFGIIHYEYFNQFDEYYIAPQFDSLKSELLQHVSIHEWNTLNIRAVNIQQKQYSRLLKASYSCNVDENAHKICNGSIISNYHIIALMVWCNFAAIQNVFYETFICLDLSVSNRQKRMQQHAQFANFGKILYETVHIFGEPVANTKHIYHCFNRSMHISSHLVSISWPISASSWMPTMLNSMTGSDGLIVELNDKNNNSKLKYFDCCFVSNWSAQNELFMIGNEAFFLQQMFEIDGIIQVRCDGTDQLMDYSNWLICWKIIIKFVSGWSYNTVGCHQDILRNVPLILHQLQTLPASGAPDVQCNAPPKYIIDLIHKYAMNVHHIEIDWFYLNNYYHFLKSFLCFEATDLEFIDFSVLLSVFKNTQKISINGGYRKHKQLTFNKKIIEYLYAFISSNACAHNAEIHLQKIVISNLNTHSTPSLQQICRMFKQKFRKMHWKIGAQFRNGAESLIFHKYA